MKNPKHKVGILEWCALVAAGTLLAGCGGLPKTVKPTTRITQPPEGKVLVNFHRPSGYGGAAAFPIFDGNGTMLIDIVGKSVYQHVCDPGEQIFLGWADHVSAVKADLAPNKVYDVMVDIGMGWWQANITLDPLNKGDERRGKLAEFESREKHVIGINRSNPRVAEYEAKNKERVAQIKKDFIGGEKSDRLRVLNRDDCR